MFDSREMREVGKHFPLRIPEITRLRNDIEAYRNTALAEGVFLHQFLRVLELVAKHQTDARGIW